MRRTSIILAMCATCVYLAYRAAFTLNLAGPYASFASLSLLAAEAYGCVLMFLYFFQIWELEEPEPVPPLKNRSVDIFIPTYNEDPDLLRGTISAAVALDYPHKTYVLDDGNRPAVAALAEELGADYISRETNLHAKAGNLNHAMEITDGEFIVIFDADHIARRDFITRLLGYFGDSKLGFVQTPHSFYNFDNFHGNLDYSRHRYWEEGELFYNVIQPGKNYWNAVSFCGSAAMFRRSALVDAGLVATETITEDMHTGLRMHARGWKSLFVNERLVSGQAATDVTTFNTQRLRWGEGNLAVFAHDNPFTMRGLTLGQRVCYLGSMLSWTTGLQKLQLYIAPMLMLLTGVAPVAEFNLTLAAITIVYMLTIWSTVTITSNGHGDLLGTELTHMASFWTQIRSTYRALFRRKKSRFVVTSKRGRQSNSIARFIMPQCLYIAGSALAIAWATTQWMLGIQQSIGGLMVGSLLLLVQCWFAWEVIRRALRASNGQEAWRHPAALHVGYEWDGSVREDDSEEGSLSGVLDRGSDFVSGRDAQTLVRGGGVSCDISELGVGFHAFEDLPLFEILSVTLSSIVLSTTVKAEIRNKKTLLSSKSNRDGDQSSWRYGTRYINPTTSNLAIIWRLCSDYATARSYDRFELQKGKHSQQSLEYLLSGSQAKAATIKVPIELSGFFAKNYYSVTEQISSRGCALVTSRNYQPGDALQVSLTTPLGVVDGSAMVVQVDQVILGATILWLVRLEFEKLLGESRSRLLALCGTVQETAVSEVLTLRPPEKRLPLGRPAALVAPLVIAACILAICGCWWHHRDDLLLNRLLLQPMDFRAELSPGMKARLERMLAETLANPSVSEDKILQLRAICDNLDQRDSHDKLTRLLLDRRVASFDARLSQAQALDELGRLEQARAAYARLLREDGKQRTSEQLDRLHLAAARNAANCKEFGTASELFKRLEHLFDDRADLRIEYAGLVAATGRPDAAIALLRNERPTPAIRYLLAALHSSKEEYVLAIEQYRLLLQADPGDGRAAQLLIDNAMWSKQWQLAERGLLRVLAERPADMHSRRKLAMTYLWSNRAAAALPLLVEQLQNAPSDSELENAFLQAIKSSNCSGKQEQLEWILQGARLLVADTNGNATHQPLDRLVQLADCYHGDSELRLALIDRLQSLNENQYVAKLLAPLLVTELQAAPMQRPNNRRRLGEDSSREFASRMVLQSHRRD